MFSMQRIDHVGIRAIDVESLAAWYADVFGMERRFGDVWSGKRDPLVMCSGEICFAFFRPREGDPPISQHQPNDHVAISLDRRNFEQAQAELRERRIEFQFWDHKICDSIYFTDPEGNNIELATYDY